MALYLPYLTSLIAVFCYAMLGPLGKKLLSIFPPLTYICLGMAILSAMAGILALFFERNFRFSSVAKADWVLLFIPITVNLIGFILFLWSISRIPVAQYQLFMILSPVFGGLVAILLLGEAFHIRYIYALVLIGLGLFVALRPELAK